MHLFVVICFWAAIVTYFAWLLSGRVRTPLGGAAGLAACATFIYLLPHA